MNSKQIRPPETMKYNEGELNYIASAAAIILACVLLLDLYVSLFAAVFSLALATLMVLIILAARSGD